MQNNNSLQQKKIYALNKIMGIYPTNKNYQWVAKSDTEFSCYSAVFNDFCGIYFVFTRQELIENKKLEKFILKNLRDVDFIDYIFTYEEVKEIIGKEKDEIQEFLLPDVLDGTIDIDEIKDDICVGPLVLFLRKKRLISLFAKNYNDILLRKGVKEMSGSIISDFWKYDNGFYFHSIYF